jgi:dTDP-4-amino-4,6-dideoxygalactose transaminase
MCNATIALEIAIRALELRGEVIVPAYTFIATAHSLQWQEITPVFADMDPRTHNIDPGSIERLITPRTTGIIGVHVWGRPCDVEGLERLANRHHLKVLYDAAHAFGCSHRGRKIGGFGSCEVFSFHATKFINSFEGGAVVTNDHALADRLRLMRNFGFAGYDNVIYERQDD